MQYDQSQISQIMSKYVSGHYFSCERLTGGGNNVLWRVHTNGASQFVIKDYGVDGSDRLDREWGYLKKLAGNKMSNVPVPIWVDRHRRLACYSHLDGKKLQFEDITETHIMQAAKFIRGLCGMPNNGLHHAKGAHFTLSAHLDEIEARVSLLENFIEQHSISPALKAFLVTCLRPDWERRKQSISNINGTDYFSSIFTFPSPSDFGFHNILFEEHALNFVDFEYAGIDDLAKLLADFSLMPEVPISETHNFLFRDAITARMDLDKNFEKRLALLEFLFPIKWVCIILNVFLPEKAERILSASRSEVRQRQTEKLELATQFFDHHKKMELLL